eukprot:Hpha_TRINITY_DN24082_c0_g1::TRINITY_DN24082_c0_g1_i1::g.130357::m.130357
MSREQQQPPLPPAAEQLAVWRGSQMTPPPRRSSASSRPGLSSPQRAPAPHTPIGSGMGRDTAGLCHTPGPGNQHDYKYYCPICMYHFKAMLRAHCCAQYMCMFCVQDQLRQRLASNGFNAAKLGDSCSRVAQQKGAEGVSPDELFSMESYKLPPADCPFCFNCPFLLHPVTSFEKVRAYADSPSVKRPDLAPGPSPVRAGADWDEITRKMRPLPIITDPLPPPPTSSSSSSKRVRRRPLGNVPLNSHGQRPPAAPRVPPS